MANSIKPLEPSLFEALANDQSIRDYSPIDPAKIHTLGRVAIAWNSCETNLFFLFAAVVQLKTKSAWIISHDMGDVAMSERISEICELGEFDDEQRDAIQHILQVYDICRQNRNSLTHFKTGVSDDGEGILLRMKGSSMEFHSLPNDVNDFRRVAVELIQLAKTLMLLWRALSRLHDGNTRPLPNKLPLPELLWKPLHQAGKEFQPPRPPSVLRLTEAEWLAKYRKEGRPLPDGAA
jgi:hypothetical protein